MSKFGSNISYMEIMKEIEETSFMKLYWHEKIQITMNFHHELFLLPNEKFVPTNGKELRMVLDLLKTKLKEPFLLWDHLIRKDILFFLFLARKYSPNCPFHYDKLPPELFEIIIDFAALNK
jgi:hypothetical protein